MYTIHKLVAEAFLDKSNFKKMPEENIVDIDINKLHINHKDENKVNNCIDNLEWCTQKYNNNYGTARIRSGIRHRNHPKISKKILCIETGEIYPSIAEAARQLCINSSNLVACLHRKTKHISEAIIGNTHKGEYELC